ncbi:hypothetical protein WJX72_008051 [[Myrmecia] bisecta]|uniref:LITAF domain-containing protein n=1 Tax=[Myrmecia] bisecta TaxID=41462 RepID=A0AAW1R865_9CHLO
MFFDSQRDRPAQVAQPAPVVEGQTVGPMSADAPLFYPADQEGPVFLGARIGHMPILLHCGTCGYQGYTECRSTRGMAHGMWALMTLGVGLLIPVAMDTQHYCPQCHKHVAVAKLM